LNEFPNRVWELENRVWELEMGKSQSIELNATEYGKMMNHRVEFERVDLSLNKFWVPKYNGSDSFLKMPNIL